MKRDRSSENVDERRHRCSGDGECLLQTDTGYARSDDYECVHDCVAVQCPNFEICESVAPKEILGCHAGLCHNCDIMFGRWQGGKGALTIGNLEECYVCFEENVKGVSMPKCDHVICTSCFKRFFYGDRRALPKCPFPETEYYDFVDSNAERPDWLDDDAMARIQRWEQICNSIQLSRDKEYEKERNLRCCPFCRK